ncbi:hypothetical protein ACN47E_006668 [Coniothyrium glycines]
MLLFSPPRCNFPPKHSLFSRTSSLPIWLAARSNSIPLSPRLSRSASAPAVTPTQHHPSPRRQPQQHSQPQPQPQPPTRPNMSLLPDTPRSAPFSPTLGSIPEVFEYEPLDASLTPPTPNEQGIPEAFVPDHAALAQPELTKATSRIAIIQSPPRKVVSPRAVSRVLRKVLEADRARRAKIMRIYLKAIVFLKYVWRANERYGNVMVTTGMYMQR